MLKTKQKNIIIFCFNSNTPPLTAGSSTVLQYYRIVFPGIAKDIWPCPEDMAFQDELNFTSSNMIQIYYSVNPKEGRGL